MARRKGTPRQVRRRAGPSAPATKRRRPAGGRGGGRPSNSSRQGPQVELETVTDTGIGSEVVWMPGAFEVGEPMPSCITVGQEVEIETSQSEVSFTATSDTDDKSVTASGDVASDADKSLITASGVTASVTDHFLIADEDDCSECEEAASEADGTGRTRPGTFRQLVRKVKQRTDKDFIISPKIVSGFSKAVIYQSKSKDINPGVRIWRSGMRSLHCVLEDYLTKFIADTYSCTEHRKKKTMMPVDSRLVSMIRSRQNGGWRRYGDELKMGVRSPTPPECYYDRSMGSPSRDPVASGSHAQSTSTHSGSGPSTSGSDANDQSMNKAWTSCGSSEQSQSLSSYSLTDEGELMWDENENEISEEDDD